MKDWKQCSLKTKVSRWQEMLRVLRSLSRHQRTKHFDMQHWARKTDCGTVGCAAGLCALDPWFKRRGLKLTWNPNGDSAYIEDPARFFGVEGSDRILWNYTRRPVRVVIKEIEAHIQGLKA